MYLLIFAVGYLLGRVDRPGGVVYDRVATAFKGVPPLEKGADVTGVAPPLLEVWAHDAVSDRWVLVDEGSALVVNEKATAYDTHDPDVLTLPGAPRKG